MALDGWNELIGARDIEQAVEAKGSKAKGTKVVSK